MFQLVSAQTITDPAEGLCLSNSFVELLNFNGSVEFYQSLFLINFCSPVAALNRMIDYWNLRTKLNLTVDPCTENAPWASEDANPRVRCDCTANPCHVTHLLVQFIIFITKF